MNAKRLVFGILAVYLAAVFMLGTARAAGPNRWEHYRSRVSGNVVVIATRCSAEDSSAHLRLRDYRDGGAVRVYGCARRGF